MDHTLNSKTIAAEGNISSSAKASVIVYLHLEWGPGNEMWGTDHHIAGGQKAMRRIGSKEGEEHCCHLWRGSKTDRGD